MPETYRQVLREDGTVNSEVIFRVSDSAYIPTNPENRDYAAFLVWQTGGGVILSADPPSPTQAQITAQQRTNALALLDSLEGDAKAQRSLLLAVIDEVNELRQRFNDLQADAQASNNLNQLKPLWALRLSLPARTGAGLKTVMTNKITTGAAD